jgi:hypothetical protein
MHRLITVAAVALLRRVPEAARAQGRRPADLLSRRAVPARGAAVGRDALAPRHAPDAPAVRARTRRRRATLVALCLSGLGIIACGDPTEPESLYDGPPTSGEALLTDRVLYTAVHRDGEGTYRRYEFTVVARFTNHATTTVYLQRCYPDSPTPIYGVTMAEEREGTTSGWGLPWACVGHDRPFEVRPGETRTDTLHVIGPNAFSGPTGEPTGTLVGRMRLRYEVRTCRDGGDCLLRDGTGRSNVFEVRLAP